jgi:8-oxo-dGTP pyrophosphatase MutT (NUDIX family)
VKEGQVRIVAGLLRRRGKVLLGHRHPDRLDHPNVWDLPGGHVEADEAIGDALRRELSEELGIELLFPPGEPWMTLSDGSAELDVFIVDDWQGEPSNRAEDEHDLLRWVDRTELDTLELAHPSYLDMLRQALDE